MLQTIIFMNYTFQMFMVHGVCSRVVAVAAAAASAAVEVICWSPSFGSFFRCFVSCSVSLLALGITQFLRYLPVDRCATQDQRKGGKLCSNASIVLVCGCGIKVGLLSGSRPVGSRREVRKRERERSWFWPMVLATDKTVGFPGVLLRC